MPGRRPPVSVVVPFRGDAPAARRLAAVLERLRLGTGDELIVADNTAGGVASEALDGGIRVVRADRERSSYHARNAGARAAGGEWILFMDADCTPPTDLLEAYFDRPVAPDCGALAGGVVPEPHQRGVVARYARARGFLVVRPDPGGRPSAAAGNLLVRRAAFEDLGGYVEGIRSGGDIDFSLRLQDAGYTLELRPDAAVTHPHRERLLSYLATVRRYAAGARWLDRRYPGSAPRWALSREPARVVRDAAALWAKGDTDEAGFRLIDGLSLIAHNVGYGSPNSARRHSGPR